MKRLLLFALTALTLVTVGCGFLDRKIAGYTGHSTTCIDGVRYIQFTSGASVKYTKDGRIETCD